MPRWPAKAAKGEEDQEEENQELVSDADAKLAALVEELDVEGVNSETQLLPSPPLLLGSRR